MPNPYLFSGLSAEPYQPLFQLSDAELCRRAMFRVTAEAQPGFPCRISLEDAAPGETLLAMHHRHHDVDGPYRASGPIFIRRNAIQARLSANEIPPFLVHRTLSLRCYDRDHRMIGAEVAAGDRLAELVAVKFADRRTCLLQVHNAAQGCFLCAAVPLDRGG